MSVYRLLPERTALPGALDRTVLASAVGFALDSVRRGMVDPATGALLPWFDDEQLVWVQGDWIASGSSSRLASDAENGWLAGERVEELLADTDPDCGTGCCIAGWIELHSPGAPDRHDGNTPARAAYLLVGFSDADAPTGRPESEDDWPELPGLPDGMHPREALRCLDGGGGYDDLFAGGNDLADVFRTADNLLVLYGMEPLVVEADGTVR